MNAEEKAEKLDEIVDLLNNDNSISLMAYDYNVLYCIEELINLYQEAEDKLEEVNDTVGFYKSSQYRP